MKYKGIELEGLDKKVKLSHSRVMETDEGTDWIDKLLTCDKAALTPTQFHEVSALSSVINMDYQICNGGISQYVFNGYHEDCTPYSDDDVAHLGQSGQVAMLRELASFGDEAFPASRDENGAIRRWAGEFRFLDWFSLFKVRADLLRPIGPCGFSLRGICAVPLQVIRNRLGERYASRVRS